MSFERIDNVRGTEGTGVRVDQIQRLTLSTGEKSKEEQLAAAGISTTAAHRYEQRAAPNATLALPRPGPAGYGIYS
jgi:hypothetical protein